MPSTPGRAKRISKAPLLECKPIGTLTVWYLPGHGWLELPEEAEGRASGS